MNFNDQSLDRFYNARLFIEFSMILNILKILKFLIFEISEI